MAIFKKIYLKILLFFLKPLLNRVDHLDHMIDILAKKTSKIEDVYLKTDTDLKKKIEFVSSNFDKINYELKDIKEDLTGKIPDNFDYIKFENLFRGSEADIKKKQKSYVKYFDNKRKVFDLGCGRGEFLEVLRESNIEAIGVDKERKMEKVCRQKGLNFHYDDIFDFLQRFNDHELDNVFLSEVIEHFSFFKVIELINILHKKMAKDSILLIETLNPLVYTSFSNSYILDPTHKTLMHPSLLVFLLKETGFNAIDLNYTSPVNKKSSLEKIQIKDVDSLANEKLNNNFSKLNVVLFGYQEYFVLCRGHGREDEDGR